MNMQIINDSILQIQNNTVKCIILIPIFPQEERCDGSPNCIDNSDESEEECGPGHITKRPLPPAVTSSPKPPIVTPPHITSIPSSMPEDPDIAFPETPAPTIDWCREESLCTCPDPNQHFCVACNNVQSCSALGLFLLHVFFISYSAGISLFFMHCDPFITKHLVSDRGKMGWEKRNQLQDFVRVGGNYNKFISKVLWVGI